MSDRQPGGAEVIDRLDSIYVWLIATLTGVVASVGTWLIRRILTNQEQIKILQQEIAVRNAQRSLEMDTFRRIELDLREMRSDIKTLFSTGGSLNNGD